MAALIPLIFIILTVVLVSVAVSAQQKQLRGLDLLIAAGTPARGLIMQVGNTVSKTTINGRPFDQRSLVLEIEIQGQAPYQANISPLVPRSLSRNVVPGATLELRVDPADPMNVAVVPPGTAYIPGTAQGAFVPGQSVTTPGPAFPPSAPFGDVGRARSGGLVVALALLAAVLGVGGVSAVIFLSSSGGSDGTPDGGWCKAAARCCKTAGVAAVACASYTKSGASSEACKSAYHGHKNAAAAAGKSCR